ncbi:hypothetical protein ACQR3P_30520 [Rhodococcus sp. IEGM1300]
MYQIDNSTAAATIPASTSAGAPGFFTDGNPATGVAATIMPAEFMNMLMMEIINVLGAAGITPSKSNFTQLITAIRAVNRQVSILADTGVAGTYSAVNSPALSALPTTGYIQRVNIANLNPGASTYSPDGLAAKPIYGLGLQPLQGGELAVGVAILMYLVQAGVNGGNGAWIIIESLGGAQQIATATKGQHAAQLAQTALVQSARGLVGANNATTPNTQYDVAADFLVLRNPSTGSLANITATGTLTCNLATAGPAVNGRDQSGAFLASTWVHVYFIWNGSTLATVVSLNAPPAGPTLTGALAGYTHWFYVGALYFNASSQLTKTRYRGNRAIHYTQVGVVTNGSATSQTAASTATGVPPNAQTAIVIASGQMNTSASGGAQSFIGMRVDSGSDAFTVPFSAAASSVALANGTQELPNIGQNIYYLWYSETNPGNISLRSSQIAVCGFTVSNGAC